MTAEGEDPEPERRECGAARSQQRTLTPSFGTPPLRCAAAANCASVESLSLCSRCRSAFFCSHKCQRARAPLA